MDITCDKFLIIANPRIKKHILTAAGPIPGLKFFEADSENKAFELIYSHNFALTIVDETLEHIDLYKIGAMLLSHQSVYSTPLLIVTDDIRPDRFLTDFKSLQIDFIQKPFSEKLIQARMTLFLELFKHKNAVSQSMKELDQAYSSLVEQNDRMMHSEMIRKKLVHKFTITALQMQKALPGIKNIIRYLSLQSEAKPHVQSGAGSLKQISAAISQSSRKLIGVKGSAPYGSRLSNKRQKTLKFLYVQPSDEEFSMFDQCLKNTIPNKIIRAGTNEEAISLIARDNFDLVITDHTHHAGSGFDLLSKLRQMRSDIPIIFALSRARMREGSKALARGALSFFIKEEMTAGTLIPAINSTLEKSRIRRQAETAANRIIMVAQQDTTTHLFTRRYFEKILEEEILRAKRYKTKLSIIIIHFNVLAEIRDRQGSETADALLNKFAGLVKSAIRTGDTASRFEEDRFALILPHTGLEGAGIMARRICRLLSDYQFTNPPETIKQGVHVSAAQLRADETVTGSQLTEQALKALASAIKNGKNVIELYDPDYH